jgi:hypothetical protein
MTIASLEDKFEQLKVFESIFGFLFYEKMLKLLDSDEFKKFHKV